MIHITGLTRSVLELISPVVRGLEYYTGMVYEAELTFPVLKMKKVKKWSLALSVVAGVMMVSSSASQAKKCQAQAFPSVSRLMTALKTLASLAQMTLKALCLFAQWIKILKASAHTKKSSKIYVLSRGIRGDVSRLAR